jgi:hypothetical protein
MKHLLFAILAITLMACNKDDDRVTFHEELLPVNNVTFPTQFKRDSLYIIPIEYIRPSTCHAFEGFYYSKNLNKRTVAVATTVFEQNNCTTPSLNTMTADLRFIPTTEASYIFRLWKGKDGNGNDVFQEFEIPVVP